MTAIPRALALRHPILSEVGAGGQERLSQKVWRAHIYRWAKEQSQAGILFTTGVRHAANGRPCGACNSKKPEELIAVHRTVEGPVKIRGAEWYFYDDEPIYIGGRCAFALQQMRLLFHGRATDADPRLAERVSIRRCKDCGWPLYRPRVRLCDPCREGRAWYHAKRSAEIQRRWMESERERAERLSYKDMMAAMRATRRRREAEAASGS